MPVKRGSRSKRSPKNRSKAKRVAAKVKRVRSLKRKRVARRSRR